MHRPIAFRTLKCCAVAALVAAAVVRAEQTSLREIQSAVLAKPYRVQLSIAVQGAAPFTYALGGDVKPACLAVNPLSGVLHGTPTRACLGNHRIHVVVTDYDGTQTSQDFLLHVTDGILAGSKPSQQTAAAGARAAKFEDMRGEGLNVKQAPPAQVRVGAPLPRPAAPSFAESKSFALARVLPRAGLMSSERDEQTSGAGAARLSRAVLALSPAAYQQGVAPGDAASASREPKSPVENGGSAQPHEIACGQPEDWTSTPPPTAGAILSACESNAIAALQTAQTCHQAIDGPNPASGFCVKSLSKDDLKNLPLARVEHLRPLLLDLRDKSADLADSLKAWERPGIPPADQSQLDARISYWRDLNSFLAAHQDDIDEGNDIGDLKAKSFDPIPPFIQHAETFGIVGTTLSTASDITPAAKLFAELYGDVPVIRKGNYGLRTWGYGRIGSIVQQTAPLSSAAVATSVTQALSSSSQSFVQSGEFTGGLSFSLLPLPWKPFAGGPSLSFILGGGAITPLTAPSAQGSGTFYVTPQIYNTYTAAPYNASSGGQTSVASQLNAACGNPPTTTGSITADTPTNCYVAFYPEDRSRFFRHYEAGVRLKFPLASVMPGNEKFPLTVDATFGQNEYVTGGKFNGGVAHLGGTAPLIYALGIYAFGGLDLGVHGPGDRPGPLLLATPSTATMPPSATNTVNIQLPQPNRDRYTLGVGWDIMQIIKNKTPPTQR